MTRIAKRTLIVLFFSSVKSKYLSDGTEVDLIDVEDNTVVGGKKVQISDTRQCAVGSNQIAGTY